MKSKKLAQAALLSAIALTIFVLESQIPLPLPVPGLRLGLSNVVILFALFALGWKEALGILLVRIFLGNIFSGQMMAMLYSLGGGALAFTAMGLLSRVVPQKQIWAVGVVGGLAHNIGQMAVAVAITQTPELLMYLPVLLLCGMITGAFTGVCAQLLVKRRFR